MYTVIQSSIQSYGLGEVNGYIFQEDKNIEQL